MRKIVREITAFENDLPETKGDFGKDEKKKLSESKIKKVKKTKVENKLEDQINDIKEKLSKLGV